MPITEETTQGPVTVVEFSLCDTTRNELQAALKPYVEDGQPSSPEDLATIMNNILGEKIISQLKNLKTADENNSTVYIIHNLPEVEVDKAIELNRMMTLPLRNSSYTNQIAIGIAHAVELVHERSFSLDRHAKNEDVFGMEPHKHSEEVTGLGGIYSDGTVKTRFTNWANVIKEQDVGEEKISSLGKTVKLKEFDHKFLGWKKPVEMLVNYASEEQFQRITPSMDKNSVDIPILRGDLALWSNRGVLLHQALPSTQTGTHDSEEIIRLVVGHIINKPASDGAVRTP